MSSPIIEKETPPVRDKKEIRKDKEKKSLMADLFDTFVKEADKIKSYYGLDVSYKHDNVGEESHDEVDIEEENSEEANTNEEAADTIDMKEDKPV